VDKNTSYEKANLPAAVSVCWIEPISPTGTPVHAVHVQ
jgi:hypothetical protein